MHFFPKQRDLLFGNSVIYIFFSLNVSSGKPTHPLPHPVSLNLVRKNVMFLFEIQNKNNAKNSFVFSYFIFFKDLHLSFTESRLGINKGWFLSTQKNEWMDHQFKKKSPLPLSVTGRFAIRTTVDPDLQNGKTQILNRDGEKGFSL